MYDLILQGETQNRKKRDQPIIQASYKLGVVRYAQSRAKVSNDGYEQLHNWIRQYKEQATEPLKCEGHIPVAITKDRLQFREFYSISNRALLELDPTKAADRVSLALMELGEFDCFYQGGWHPGEDAGALPTFIGSMTQNLIQFKGECYHSYSMEFFTRIFLWLELYLSHKPQNIRIEFWMSYFNTSTHRRFRELIEVLEVYQERSQAQVTIYWYCDESDFDAIEQGELYQKETTIDFVVEKLNEEEWDKMVK